MLLVFSPSNKPSSLILSISGLLSVSELQVQCRLFVSAVCVLIPPVLAVNMAGFEEEGLRQLADPSGKHAAVSLRAKSL